MRSFAAILSKAFWFIPFRTTRAAICSALLLGTVANAEDNTFAARAERAFSSARENVRTEPTNTITLVQLARAAFDWAEFSQKDEQRADIANAGIGAVRTVIRHDPTNAAAYYWLGMNLAQLARTKSLGALKIVRQMEEELHRARTLDPHTDYAGPDRSLAFLYRDAPGWPTSIGNKKKAREHFERAVQLHPEFPDNQLGLLESYDEWGEPQNFERQIKITERVLAEAKSKFTGPEWDLSWTDWNKRLAKMQRKSKQSPGKVGK